MPPQIIGNSYQKFELSLPFGRTNVDAFAKRIRAAAEKDKVAGKGDGKTVSLESLREVFTSPAWEEIK
jgi:hypothetical protein